MLDWSSGELRYMFLASILPGSLLQCLWSSQTHLLGNSVWEFPSKVKSPPKILVAANPSSVSIEHSKRWILPARFRTAKVTATSCPTKVVQAEGLQQRRYLQLPMSAHYVFSSHYFNLQVYNLPWRHWSGQNGFFLLLLFLYN